MDLKHLFLKMCLLFCFCGTGHLLYSQITLRENNVLIEEVINKIEASSDYRFLYNKQVVNVTGKVSISVQNENIHSTLDKLFENSDISYSIDGKQIVLNKKSDSATIGTKKKTISGSITDENQEALMGASVSEKGKANGTITDEKGNFTLDVTPGAVIVVSYLGFLPQEITVGNQTGITVRMKEDNKVLNEIVVVGFAKQRKINLTGAVSGVKMDELLKERPVTNTATLLQGAIPGLQITSGSGEPGAGYSFNIRGATNIDIKDNKVNYGAPLILVDNVPLTGPLALINPDDIESVSVLKDGGSAAIYGARGAFGVVLITTKGAQFDKKTKVNYTGNIAFTSPGELPVKSSPLQTVQAFKDFGYTGSTPWRGRDTDKWIELLNEYNANPSLYPNGYAEYGGLIYMLRENDLMKDFLSETGLQQVHNVSISGGSAKTSYRISLGYVDSDGVIVTNKDSYSKYSVRSFLNTQILPWLTGQLDMNYYQSNKSMPNRGNNWSDAVAIPSFIPTGNWTTNDEELPLGTPGNMVRMGAVNTDGYVDTRLTGRLIATPLAGLTITGEYTHDHLTREQVDYSKKLTYLAFYDFDKTISPLNSQYDNTKRAIKNDVFNLFASYDKTINNHKFTVLGGFNVEKYYEDYLKASVTNMINDELPSVDQSIGEKTPSDYFYEYALMGAFGRVGYSFLDRYLFEFNGRYDGSSKFPSGHRWGFFPSFSVGWRIAEEPFMRSLKNIIPELKVRASYATIGNQNISSYLFVPTMDIAYNWVNGGIKTPTLGSPGLVRSNFSWETIETSNIGLDIGLLRGRLNAVLDFYNRKTKDMLDSASELPAIIGASAPMQNVADLESKGWEIDLRWKDRIGKVGYYIGINLYDYRAKITKLPSNSTFQIGSYYEGFEIGSIWGAVTDRLYQESDFDSNGNLLPGIAYPDGIPKPSPGDVLFVDFDGDGVIRTSGGTLDKPYDRKIIGNNSLRYQFGITGGLNWNHFDFSFFIQGVGKRDLWLANELTFPSYYEWGSSFNHLMDYWTPDNTNAYYPRGYAGGTKNNNYNSNIRTQTRYLQNGAYLRVKNISLGYTIPASVTKKWGMERIKANVNVENPFLFHHLAQGLDPTLDSKGRGLGYPVMRIYSLGLSLDF